MTVISMVDRNFLYQGLFVLLLVSFNPFAADPVKTLHFAIMV